MVEKTSEPLLARLSRFVTERTGLYFPREKWVDLERNLGAAARDFGFESTDSCIEWLLSSELTQAQMETLASHLTVGETYFFRENQIFEILAEQLVPAWRAARGETGIPLRIWSAGCCSGEEPFSIAILLSKAIPDWKRWNIHILGTDINVQSLQKASRGIYSEWSFRDTPSWVKEHGFQKLDHKGYEILPQFRERVTFGYLNLSEDTYPSLQNGTNAMDLIFCRNVLMYFAEDQAQRVINRFHNALVTGGLLVVSATETSPTLYRQFASEDFGGFTFYRKTQAKAPVAVAVPSEATEASVRAVMEAQVHPGEITPCEPAGEHSPYGYDAAVSLYQSGDYAEATGALLRSNSPVADTRVAMLLARSYANLGRIDEALRWCDLAIAADKMNSELYYLRAIILQEQGRLEASAVSLKRALYLDPDYVLPHFALGNLALRRNGIPEAVKHFQNALSLLSRFEGETLLPGSEGLTAARLAEIIRATLMQEAAA